MAVRVEQTENGIEYVIDGWERGIAASPEGGLADMRNINNDSQPGVALCNFKLVQKSQTHIASATVTFSVGNNNMTWTGTDLISPAPVAVIFGNSGGALPAALSTNTVYWLVRTSANTANIFKRWDWNSGANSPVTLADAGTGTSSFSTVNPTKFTDYTQDLIRGLTFAIDNIGQVWVIGTNSNLIHTGDDILNYLYTPVLNGGGQDGYGGKINAAYGSGGADTTAAGQGIVVFNNYLFTFRDTIIDAFGGLNAVSTATYTNSWKTGLTNGYGGSGIAHVSHHAKVGEDNIVYFCNTNYVGNISGGTVTGSLVHTSNLTALTLPSSEIAQWLEEPSVDTSNGNLIYISTLTSNLIYPWDKYTTNFFAPLVMTEVAGYKMLNINRIVYILAGDRGNIYYTNGSSVTLFRSMPKYPTGLPYPLFSWGGIMSLNNNLCFGVQDQNTSGVAQNNASGAWAVQIASEQSVAGPVPVAGSIRYKGQPSAGMYNTDVLIPLNNGMQYLACSYDGSFGYVDLLDSTTPTFYTNYESYIETDIIRIGTPRQPANISEIWATLDTPLATGEKFKVDMRSNLTTPNTSYTNVFEVTTANSLFGTSLNSGTPLQNLQWLQLKVSMQSTPTSSTYVRLKDIRFRI